jgi:hypothetical protein
VRKLHALPFILCHEFNSVHVNLLVLKLDGQIDFIIIIISFSNFFLAAIFYFVTFLALPKFYLQLIPLNEDLWEEN